ncbi:uncharacterized protein MYCFIDRAFT_197082 [Pseudocercospora fijiensis CIRAD86]|uniref:Uncharacterized protein n=1 Tax=Pseudocercospora fijiensis (strain CIRAD86) TaxID=383855 RepID=M2YVR5_PSEFD|nr:uncharacterized protein MYCFIDRAFT_197082 [Pseudocercospora fijiensis CIRAD86]EME81775.1 hypothetical protein MYCFIDRAFT_197082 [Pseudocercospora fijiensis CIRAD86]
MSPMPETTAFSEKSGSSERSQSSAVSEIGEWLLYDEAFNPVQNDIQEGSTIFDLPLRSRHAINIPPSDHNGDVCDNKPASDAEESGNKRSSKSVRSNHDRSTAREAIITGGCKIYQVLKRRCFPKSAANYGPQEAIEPDGCLPCFTCSKQSKQRNLARHALLSSDDVTQPQQPQADEKEHAAYQANRHEATLSANVRHMDGPDEYSSTDTLPYRHSHPKRKMRETARMPLGTEANGIARAPQQVRFSSAQRMELENQRQGAATLRSDTPMRDQNPPQVPDRESSLRGSTVAVYASSQASLFRGSNVADYEYQLESPRSEVEDRFHGLDFGVEWSGMDLEGEVERVRRDMEGL